MFIYIMYHIFIAYATSMSRKVGNIFYQEVNADQLVENLSFIIIQETYILKTISKIGN